MTRGAMLDDQANNVKLIVGGVVAEQRGRSILLFRYSGLVVGNWFQSLDTSKLLAICQNSLPFTLWESFKFVNGLFWVGNETWLWKLSLMILDFFSSFIKIQVLLR